MPYTLAIVYPKVASLAALMGSCAALLVQFLLPVATYAKLKHTSIYNPELTLLMQRSTMQTVSVPLSP